MKVSYFGNIKWLILSLLITTGFIGPLYSQTKIHNIINQYARVNSIGADYVIIDDETQFHKFTVGDTVLLIQMKGARIYAYEDPSYGTGYALYGKPGKYEFLTISLLDDGTNRVEFMADIVNTLMDVNNDVQLIKVPSYNYAVVDGTLTCQAWDSLTKTGGVLAAIIGRTLSLNANIDVTGKGFKGGTAVEGKGICIVDAPLKWDKYAYHASTDSAGNKGEGLALRGDTGSAPYVFLYPDYAKGKGANFTGGGGGNGKFSGGGGGSNYGAGGKGGREINTCSPPSPGGLEGKEITGTGMDGGMFMGGGGGSSTYISGGTWVPGGNGGGMIILVCDTLLGNGYSILAEGAFPGTASGNAGAGGGGGGGTIALYLQSYSENLATSALSVSANGGKGGSNSGTAGEGGGGGGGLIITNNITLPVNVTKTVAGGAVGTRPIFTNGTNGSIGRSNTTFTPLLNGFLFNSIRSTVTGNQVDSICSNVIPPTISGTIPAGTGPFTFKWQKSYNLSGAPSEIAGATSKDYTFSATEADTLWIRRIVTDNGSDPIINDTSKWVNIIVQPAITGNLVGKDTTICYNQDPLNLIPLNTGPANGNGIYQYRWIQSLNDADWSSPATSPGTSDLASYDPPALTITTYFKRKVTSGRCIDQSSTVAITVLPSITGNITYRPDSVICEGSLFNTLGATAPGGGSGSYVYLWQDSTASGSWSGSPFVNNTTTYTPDTLTFAVTEQRYYRRVVFSGPDSVCRSNSSPILMTRYHYIENNTISKDTTICSGSVPSAFAGSDPEKGFLVYTYQWLSSADNNTFTNLTAATSRDYQPDALTDTTWYRRIVNSSKCADTSNILVINVHKPIINNHAAFVSGPGADTTVCSGAKPNKLIGSAPAGGTNIPGDYAFHWSYSIDNNSFEDDSSPSGTLKDYQPVALTTTTWFRRKTISGECISFSDTLRVIVLPKISNNIISSDQTICYGTVPAQITGTPLTGGAGGTPIWIWEQSPDGITWSPADGISNGQNYSPPALTNPMKYRRIVLSGAYDCCADTSEILNIGIHQLPAGTLTSGTDTICSGSDVLLHVILTGAPKWKLVYKRNSDEITVSNIAASDTIIKSVPSATSSMSVFDYSLVSVEDQNHCLATSLTGTRKAIVYRVPVADAGPDDQICGPEYTLSATPSDGTGTWIFPSDVLQSVINDPGTKIKIDSSFNNNTEASVTHTFYWKEINWQCTDKDSVTIKFHNRIDNINAGCDTTLYSFDYIMQLSAAPIKSYETGKWSVVAGTGDFVNDTARSADVRNISKGLNTFKWTITNGKCQLEDMINVNVYDLLIPEGFSPNNDPGNYNNTFIITGLDLRKKLVGSDSVNAYQDAELIIVNSAGTQIFTTTNRNGSEWKNWDGTNSKGIDMPEGTYYYMLKITSIETGKVYKESGFIILKRY